MNNRNTDRILARVRSASLWAMLALAVKCAACLALPSLTDQCDATALAFGGIGFASLAVLTMLVAASIGREPRWGFGFAAIASVDVLLTALLMGLPPVHPALMISLVAFFYVGGADRNSNPSFLNRVVQRRERAAGNSV